MIYEAKVLDVDYLDQKHPKSDVSGPHYLIHYKEPRVLKFNETNLSKRKQIEESFNKKNKASTGKKRRREQSIDKDEILKKPIIAIPIPEMLKSILVQDWENINTSQLVVRLPRKPSVVDIIDHYKLLLYQLERQQYRDLKSKFDKLESSQLYGAEHFLRLFALISSSNVEEDTLTTIKDHLIDFLKVILKVAGGTYSPVSTFHHSSIGFVATVNILFTLSINTDKNNDQLQELALHLYAISPSQSVCEQLKYYGKELNINEIRNNIFDSSIINNFFDERNMSYDPSVLVENIMNQDDLENN
ncbi:7674_t:CDS:10 [Entrophospora sp. SA101]|nr:7674_t:CDS:10 [Entrophospora sp. SA101]